MGVHASDVVAGVPLGHIQSISNKPLESISEADLQTLLLDEVPEGKTLEYKQELPGGSDEQRMMFHRSPHNLFYFKSHQVIQVLPL